MNLGNKNTFNIFYQIDNNQMNQLQDVQENKIVWKFDLRKCDIELVIRECKRITIFL